MNYRMILALFVFMVAQASVNTVAFAQNPSQNQPAQSGTIIEFSGTELWEFFEKNNLAEEYDCYFSEEVPNICKGIVGFVDRVKKINNQIDFPGQNGRLIGNFKDLRENFPIWIPDSLFKLGPKRQAVPSQNQNLDNLQDALDSGPKKGTQDSAKTDTATASSAFQRLEDNDTKIYETLQAQEDSIHTLSTLLFAQRQRLDSLAQVWQRRFDEQKSRIEELENLAPSESDQKPAGRESSGRASTDEESVDGHDSGKPKTIIEQIDEMIVLPYNWEHINWKTWAARIIATLLMGTALFYVLYESAKKEEDD